MAVTRGPILVLAAHPDDEVLGCGGSLLKWKDAGHPIHVAFAGAGRSGGAQANEAEAVAKACGWSIVSLWDFPDQQFDGVGVKNLAEWAARNIQTVRPCRILTHTSHDLNSDHRILHEAVRVAIRGNGAKEVLAFPVPISGYTPFAPTLFVDVTHHLERKLKALTCYASEERETPNPRSPQNVEALALVWGGQANCMYAEAFEVIRMIWGQTSGTAS